MHRQLIQFLKMCLIISMIINGYSVRDVKMDITGNILLLKCLENVIDAAMPLKDAVIALDLTDARNVSQGKSFPSIRLLV